MLVIEIYDPFSFYNTSFIYIIDYSQLLFCPGYCHGLSRSAAEKIYQQAMQTNNHDFWLEDVYFTGTVSSCLLKYFDRNLMKKI